MRIITLIFLFAVLFLYSGCKDDNPVTQEIKAVGVFILYEGQSSNPNSFDYGYLDIASGNINSNLYRTNNGSSLNKTPSGMILHANNDLYVTAQGTIGGQGTIYKINSSTNQLISSRNFGKNPYNMTFYNNKIYASNLYGSHVSVMNMDLSPINDSLEVGSYPTDMIVALDNIYVAKANFTTQKSLAIINTITNSVSKIFFNAPPVSVANNVGGIYVSTYTGKKIYTIDSLSNQFSDSISINIPEFAIGTIISGRPGILYVLGIENTTLRARKVYRYNILSRLLDPAFEISFSGINDIYGISYDPFESRLYITNSKSGLENGELLVYNEGGTNVGRYPNVGGIAPKRIAIKY